MRKVGVASPARTVAKWVELSSWPLPLASKVMSVGDPEASEYRRTALEAYCRNKEGIGQLGSQLVWHCI